MIDAKVDDEALEINITGLDAWLMDVRRRSIKLTVPLSDITEASVRGRWAVTTYRHVLDSRRGLVTCARLFGKILHVTARGNPTQFLEQERGGERDLSRRASDLTFIRLSVSDPDDLAATINARRPFPH